MKQPPSTHDVTFTCVVFAGDEVSVIQVLKVWITLSEWLISVVLTSEFVLMSDSVFEIGHNVVETVTIPLESVVLYIETIAGVE